MYYALATNQDFFAEKLNRFVALASCIFIDVEELGLDRNYETFAYDIKVLTEELGVFNTFGGDESSLTAEKVCDRDDIS